MIADSLREAIISAEIRAGERLQEVELAERFNSSRTPVREALRQLESEGFITIRPRRGATVAAITSKDIEEFYELKSVLEGFAARQAVTRITDDEVRRMSRLNDKLENLRQKGDIPAMVEVHNRFHEVFVQACGNERLGNLLKNLVNQYQRFRISLSHTDAIVESIEMHRQIVEAFRSRDAELAEELVRRNSLEGSKALLARLPLSSSPENSSGDNDSAQIGAPNCTPIGARLSAEA